MAGIANDSQPIEMGKLAERFCKRAGPDYKMAFYCCEQLVPLAGEASGRQASLSEGI